MLENANLGDQRSSLEMARHLFEELRPPDLEAVASKILRRHRRQLRRAQHLFESLETASSEQEPLLDVPYRLAMVELRVQHELLAVALEVLGHIPRNADVAGR